jgi:hypothetical protein
MGANQRTAATTYSNLGAFEGENIGTGHGTPAQNVTSWGSYRPQKNMTQVLWNAGFSTNAQWSSQDGTGNTGAGPGGSGNGPGIGGSNANLGGTFSTTGGTGATAVAAIDISNTISLSISGGGSGYGSAPAVTISGGSGSGATATSTISGGVVNSLTMTSQGTGYSSMDSLTVTIAAPGAPNILVGANSVAFTQTTGHTNYISHPTTTTEGIAIDGQNILGSGTGYGGETPFDADENTVGQFYIKFTTDSDTPDADDYLTLKIGTWEDDDTYGSYKVHGDMGTPSAVGGDFTTNEHGIVNADTSNPTDTLYWTGKIPNLNKFNGEPVVITQDDGGGATAKGYVVTSNTSTGAVASVVITDGGSGYAASEAVTMTTTRGSSEQTSCKGTVAVSGGAVTSVTVTTAGSSYKSGRVYCTLKASGNTGRKYTISQWELYVANPIASYAITKTPVAGNIVPEDTVTAASTSIAIAGDYVDTSVATTSWDFEYDGSHTSDGTTTASTVQSFTYPAAATVGINTVHSQMYIANTAPSWSHTSSFSLTSVTDSFYIEEINRVLHVYSSKTASDTNATTESDGRYVPSAIGIVQNGDQTTNPFFLFNKLHYRLEASEPCNEFYVDWDDGDDNSEEKANYEIIKLEEPSFFVSLTHIYTTHGSHYPLVRAKSVDGFWSKYYTAYEDEGIERTTLTSTINSSTASVPVAAKDNIANNDIIRVGNEYMKVTSGGGGSGAATLTVTRGHLTSIAATHGSGAKVYEAVGTNQNDFTSIESLDLESGQNDFSLVSPDHISTHKIPTFRPANLPPVAVLKTDRNRLLSGIQNSIFNNIGEGNTAGHESQTVSLDATGCSQTGTNSVKVKITYTTTSSGSTVMDAGQILTATLTDDAGTNVTHVNKILKAELVNMKEASTSTAEHLMAGERVYVEADNRVVCSLTLGNPIVKESDVLNSATLDLSESRTRASNVSISEYYVDDGNSITGSQRWHGLGASGDGTKAMQINTVSAATATLQTSDIMNSLYRTYYPSLDVQYTFQRQLDPIGTDGRFLSKEILCRGQVKDSSSTTRDDSSSGDTIEYSYIDHDNHTAYNPSTPPRPSAVKSSNLILGVRQKDSPVWENLATKNAESIRTNNQFILGGGFTQNSINTSGGKLAPKTGVEYTDRPENFILMTRKDKFDRIFMKTYNNYSQNNTGPTMSGTTTMPEVRISIYYPAKDNTGTVNWKPLPYKDTTKYENIDASSLMRDGSLTFKPPLDWEKCASADITNTSWISFGTAFNDAASGSAQPSDLWTVDSYGLLITFAIKGAHANITDLGLCFTRPYNNEHSQVLTLIDPSHVSLNTKTIAQSIGFTRQGTYSIMKSRLGKADIRKISANSGRVSFGSVDLEGNSSRKDMKEYQQSGTPVYLDVEHKNGDFTRFFGVIESMSEDHPTGKMLPKYGLNMIVSHILEYNSSGTMISNDYISLGGNVDYESEYIQ